jgi:hypothetical protein
VTVEKIQRVDSTNFAIAKNQQLTGHRKSEYGRIYGFSTGSLERIDNAIVERHPITRPPKDSILLRT